MQVIKTDGWNGLKRKGTAVYRWNIGVILTSGYNGQVEKYVPFAGFIFLLNISSFHSQSSQICEEEMTSQLVEHNISDTPSTPMSFTMVSV